MIYKRRKGLLQLTVIINRLIIMRPTHGDVKVSTGVRVV